MAGYNPFGSWADSSSGNPSISIFGALPYPTPTPAASADFHTFYMTAMKPDLMNCTIVGPQSQVYFYIESDPHNPGYTVMKDSTMKSLALIEWRAKHPLVEIRGVLGKQRVGEWLKVSADHRYRTMEVRGRQYVWSPEHPSINLYSPERTCIARITRSASSVSLELSNEAFQNDLLNPILIAALLLQSGRHID